MDLASDQEAENTRAKLRSLEETYANTKAKPMENPRLREWTLRSLASLIKQFKEELMRYECRKQEEVRRESVGVSERNGGEPFVSSDRIRV